MKSEDRKLQEELDRIDREAKEAIAQINRRARRSFLGWFGFALLESAMVLSPSYPGMVVQPDAPWDEPFDLYDHCPENGCKR